jgi:hypothetical protein
MISILQIESEKITILVKNAQAHILKILGNMISKKDLQAIEVLKNS